MPPKKAMTDKSIAAREKLLRHAVHKADNAKNIIKSKLNCPGQAIACISPKNTGKRLSP